MASAVEIRAPEEQTEGTRSQILRWLKSVGESVIENEPLIEIETDKVTVEVAAPGSGTLAAILKQEQEEIAPGELLGRIESQSHAAPVSGEPALVGAVRATPDERSVANGAPMAASTGTDASTGTEASTGITAAVGGGALATAANALSPAVRRLLAERGLSSSSIQGTGQGGRITVEDVLRHAAAHSQSIPPAEVPIDSAAVPSPAAARPAPDVVGPSHRVPHTGVRKRIAEHMVQSLLQTAPHVTTVFEADLSGVLRHREAHKDEFARRGAPLTLTAYFLQACVAAIRAVPEANSRWSDSALEIYDSLHIGIATALETGLVVPVLRDVQSRDLFEIAQGLNDLVSRARAGQLQPSDVRGGTFTISNHGVSGSLIATPIVINQPQSAILGLGKLEKRAVVVEGADGVDRVVIQPRCYVTLTIDHRVMDGHQANRFLQTFVQQLAASLS